MTDRVKAQQALEHLNANLAAEVARQTEALRNEKRLLLQTNEELENITYAMSHDLLTPVRHLLSFARLARQTTDTSKRDRYLGIIETSAVNLSGMIDGVMRFSRAGLRLPAQRGSAAGASPAPSARRRGARARSRRARARCCRRCGLRR